MDQDNEKITKKQPGRRKWILWAGVTIIIIAAGIKAASYILPRYEGTDAWVRIPAGATNTAVKDSLMSSLGEDAGEKVYSQWLMMGGDAAASHGAYRITSGELLIMAARRISKGRQTPVKAVWSDARSLDLMARKITAGLECSPEEFLKECDRLLPDSGFRKEEFMAAFLPNTYEVYWTVSPESLIGKLLDYRRTFWTAERREKARKMGLSEIETATLASIVEEESSKADERPKIARLYLNRLGKGMMLQADPTVKFAVGDPTLRRITGAQLKCRSPYNTYQNHGLPPGPIRIADERTIDAVLNAPAHDYIFMCAKEDFSGYHNFASDYATHQANARHYQAELDRRGIK